MSDLATVGPTPEEYIEPPEILARDLWVGVRLWTAAAAFFFLTFVFAFFYLRSLNSNNQWRPHGIDPPTGWGVAILICIVASVALFWAAARFWLGPRAKLLAALALGLALAALVIQCIEWAVMSWGPTNGGYSSVFIGWTGFYVLFLLGTIYWTETLVAEAYRDRGGAGAEARVLIRQANAQALNVFWVFLGLVELGAFVLLYLIA